jgi:hypothetical protein
MMADFRQGTLEEIPIRSMRQMTGDVVEGYLCELVMIFLQMSAWGAAETQPDECWYFAAGYLWSLQLKPLAQQLLLEMRRYLPPFGAEKSHA